MSCHHHQYLGPFLLQAYGRELSEAYEWLSKFRLSRKEAELHQAWDLYYHVFKRINKQLHSMTTLELQYVAPALVSLKTLDKLGLLKKLAHSTLINLIAIRLSWQPCIV